MRKVLVVFLGMVLMATLAMGLTATVSAQEKSDAYPAEVKAQVTWHNLDSVFGTPPSVFPIDRPYLALSKREFAVCPGEPLSSCFRVLREKDSDSAIRAFWGKNSSACQQDGYRWSSELGKMVTGIPAYFEGPMEGLTYRPCAVLGTSVVSPATTIEVTPVLLSYPTSAWTLFDEDKSRVRASADLTGTIITSLAPGTALTVTGKSGDWYAVDEPQGFIHFSRVQFVAPTATVSSSTTTTTVVTTSETTSAPPCVTATASVKWTSLGSGVWGWNAYKDNGGVFVEMILEFNEDGEYIVDDKGISPIPAGKHLVSGATVDCKN